MKSASVRDLRQGFPRVLAWLQAGEKVAITMRRQPIATLVPCARRKRSGQPLPDVARRLQKVFGHHVIPDHSVEAIMNQNRGTW